MPTRAPAMYGRRQAGLDGAPRRSAERHMMSGESDAAGTAQHACHGGRRTAKMPTRAPATHGQRQAGLDGAPRWSAERHMLCDESDNGIYILLRYACNTPTFMHMGYQLVSVVFSARRVRSLGLYVLCCVVRACAA